MIEISRSKRMRNRQDKRHDYTEDVLHWVIVECSLFASGESPSRSQSKERIGLDWVGLDCRSTYKDEARPNPTLPHVVGIC